MLSLGLAGTHKGVAAERVQAVADPVRVKPASNEGQLAIKGFTLPEGFEVELTAAEPHLANPVAFHIDEKGRFFVVETFRHGAGVLDIRGRRDWPNQAFVESLSEERLAGLSDELLDADLASKSVDDRIAMLRYYMGDEADARLGVESDQIRLIEDRDGDGVINTIDNCPDVYNPIPQLDADGDGKGDACDVDADNDGIPDPLDNCPQISNVDQEDLDLFGEDHGFDTDEDFLDVLGAIFMDRMAEENGDNEEEEQGITDQPGLQDKLSKILDITQGSGFEFDKLE